MSIVTGPEAASVALTAQLIMTAQETFAEADLPAAASGSRSLPAMSAFNVNKTFPNDVITPKAVAMQQLTIGGGITTIDLTAALAALDRYVDMTDLYIFAGLFAAPAANNGDVTIAPGAATPYPIFGAAKDILLPASRTIVWCDSQLDAVQVSGSVKNIDISGTSSDILNLILIGGEATT